VAEDLQELQVPEFPARAWASRASRVCSIPPSFSARSDAVSALLSMIGVLFMGCPVPAGRSAGGAGGEPGEQLGLAVAERGPRVRVVAAPAGAELGEVTEELGDLPDGDVAAGVEGCGSAGGLVRRSRVGWLDVHDASPLQLTAVGVVHGEVVVAVSTTARPAAVGSGMTSANS
jgi:hypothetical protein